MDSLISFLDQLEANGIEIAGRERIAPLIGEHKDLPQFIVSLASQGRSSGIVFTATASMAKLNWPVLSELMSKNGFTHEQQIALMANSGISGPVTPKVPTKVALECANELEVAIGEMMTGKRKAEKLPFESIARLIQFARDQAKESENQRKLELFQEFYARGVKEVLFDLSANYGLLVARMDPDLISRYIDANHGSRGVAQTLAELADKFEINWQSLPKDHPDRENYNEVVDDFFMDEMKKDIARQTGEPEASIGDAIKAAVYGAVGPVMSLRQKG